MTHLSRVKKAMMVVFAFLAGELGVLFLSVALAHATGAACVAYVWALPASAILGLVLIAVACASTFLVVVLDRGQ